MTDEERQELVKDLHGISHDEEGVDDYVAERCLAAADEIERLAKELANANRLLEINRRRSLEKSGRFEIKQSMPDFTKIDWNTP
jgi:hypothetical protein